MIRVGPDTGPDTAIGGAGRDTVIAPDANDVLSQFEAIARC